MQNTEKQILLLGESEKSSQLDRRALRESGYSQVKIMTSGVDAARYLAHLDQSEQDFYPDMVVCGQKLSDMDGEQFCAIIRQHPRLLALPILLILPNDSEAEQLRTLGCGASALLGRPYSIDKLKKNLEALLAQAGAEEKLRLGSSQTDTSAFDAALATYGILLRPSRNPEDYFRVGMHCLEEKQWNHAINAFQLALSNAHIKAEAELGMAAAFKGKGDMQRFKGWLSRAAETLVHARRWHLARTAYAKLLRHDPDAKNPFLTRAHQLIREKNYDDAAQTLVQSLSVIPGAKTGDRFAKICFSAADPQAMLNALENSLSTEESIRAQDLSSEIRQSLEILEKDKKQRERELAAERKWQLARKMAEQNKTQEKTITPAANAVGTESETAPLFDNDTEAEAEEDFIRIEEQETTDTNANTEVLAPLSRTEATTDIFAEKPKLNELLSVMKLTWNLAKRSRKK